MVQDGGSRFLYNISYHLPDYKVSYAESAMKISNLNDSIITGSALLTQSCKKKLIGKSDRILAPIPDVWNMCIIVLYNILKFSYCKHCRL